MPKKGNENSSSTITIRSSVRSRVLAGLTVILIAFAGITVYSIILHNRTVSKIRLINSVYLPLTLGTAEIRSTQLIFNIQMDRLADDPNDPVTREWIGTCRRLRPSTLERLSNLALNAIKKNIDSEETQFLKEIRSRLFDVRNRYNKNEAEFQRLYYTMDFDQLDKARSSIEKMKRVERNLDRVLRGVGEEVDRHITKLAEQAERDGNRATLILSLLTLITLAAAGAVIVSTNKLLAPLKALQKAVAKVARGDLKTHIEVMGQDEIGALAMGFNRMTEALLDRDQMLIRSERLATTGKMAAQVTHEIRNPLSSLGLNAELLEEELSEAATKGEAFNLLRAMQDEIQRLTGITESYLRFARLPAPDPSFNDINELVESVMEFMKNELSDNGISANMDLNRNLEPVLFDGNQIRQALGNLIRNACEAMSGGGTLRVSTKEESNWVLLEVTDTGTGVPEELVDRIFDSFYSTKSGGTGLGLPLVRQICLAHGGDIKYERTEKAGSTFVIKLPATKTEESKEA